MHYVVNASAEISGEAVEGYLVAARIAGMIAACASNKSLTHTVVEGYTKLNDALTPTDISTAEQKGCIVLSTNTSGQIWIDSAINTLVSPADNQDDGWKKIRRTKTRYELITRCNDQADALIGKVDNDVNGRAIQGSITSLYSSVGAAINSAFAAGFTTTTTVTITVNYKLANPSATISFSGGGSGTATVSGSISSNANGGFAYGPELTWWGEDGPEVIIPLGSKRRQRGLELWAQAGEMLGVGKHADGGFIGSSGSFNKNIWENTESLAEPMSESDSGTSDVSTVIDSEKNSDTKEVNLSVTVNPQFVISSTSQREDDILQIIKTHMKELADDLGGELADRLGEVFSNMPISS